MGHLSPVNHGKVLPRRHLTDNETVVCSPREMYLVLHVTQKNYPLVVLWLFTQLYYACLCSEHSLQESYDVRIFEVLKTFIHKRALVATNVVL